MNNPVIPLEFLLVASECSLGEYELAQLNKIANLERAAEEIERELRDARASADVARWFRDNRHALLSSTINLCEQTDPGEILRSHRPDAVADAAAPNRHLKGRGTNAA